MRDVWITGMGCLSGAGPDLASVKRLVSEGTSAVRHDAGDGEWASRVALPEGRRESRRLDRAGRLFRAACEDAWNDAGLCHDGVDRRRIGLFEGSSWGPLGEVVDEARGTLPGGQARRASRLSRFSLGSGGTAFAQSHAVRGPVIHLSAGSVSSAAAIGEAFLQVACGRLDLVICGGGEAPLHRDVLATFRAAGLLGPADDWPCRPFDARRSGTVLGEGAGALVLEAADHARTRGAAPRAILAGYAIATEPYDFVRPDPEGTGIAACVVEALAMAKTRGISWVKAHGTGTVLNDLAECRGLALALGARLRITPLTSLKSAVGHALGASGALEMVVALSAIQEGLLPATIGTEELDPVLPPCLVPASPARAAEGDVVLLSESFGGRCAALVVRGV